MRTIFQQDQIKLDAERITEYKHPVFGDTTVFHDVVIASEIVQPYDDGKAWKPRDELEAYTWTVDGAWVVIGAHPAEGIVSDRGQVSGRTVNSRYVKNLIDLNTQRPCRAGVRADVEIFNSRVPSATLNDMKNGKKQEVSIGFFFSKDETPGVVETDACKGQAYDFVQRNLFHNHLAAGIDNGRCPMPFCGLGADELNKSIIGDPFAGFPDFGACITSMTKPKSEGGQGYSEEVAKKVCGKLQSEHEKKRKDADKMREATKIVFQAIRDELEALKGERDATKTADKAEWWREIEWATDDSRTVFDALPEETRNLIIKAGLCPGCQDEEKETECEEGFEKNEIGECVPVKKEEEKKEDDSSTKEKISPIEEKKKKDVLDASDIFKRAEKSLNLQ